MNTYRAKRLPTVAATAIASTLVLAGCSGAGGPNGSNAPDAEAPTEQNATELTVGLTYIPDVQFAPFYLAEAGGYFADEGLDVTLRHHGAGEDLFGALDSGEEDVVVAGNDEILQARSHGVDVLSFATLYQEYPVQVFVPEDSPAQEVADLAGGSIGVPGPFGETWFGLLGYLHQASLTEEDVTIEHIGFTQYTALVEGHVDAVVGFVTSDAAAFETGELPVRTVGTPADLPLISIGLGTSEALHTDNGEALAAVNRAVEQAVQDIREDPAHAVDVTTDYLPGTLSEEDLASVERTAEVMAGLYGPEGFGTQDEQAWEEMAEFMTEAGLLEEDVSVRDAYTTDWLGTQ